MRDFRLCGGHDEDRSVACFKRLLLWPAHINTDLQHQPRTQRDRPSSSSVSSHLRPFIFVMSSPLSTPIRARISGARVIDQANQRRAVYQPDDAPGPPKADTRTSGPSYAFLAFCCFFSTFARAGLRVSVPVTGLRGAVLETLAKAEAGTGAATGLLARRRAVDMPPARRAPPFEPHDGWSIFASHAAFAAASLIFMEGTVARIGAAAGPTTTYALSARAETKRSAMELTEMSFAIFPQGFGALSRCSERRQQFFSQVRRIDWTIASHPSPRSASVAI